MIRTRKQGLKEIYVVGCGPSLKGFNWTLLADKTTIAVNGSLKDVPNPNIFITADSYFAFRAAHANFWNIDTHKVLVMGTDHAHYKRVKPVVHQYDHRIVPVSFGGQIGLSKSQFATGQNSGFCGLQYAVILGAKVIHLLGMDFCCEDSSSNYHGLYTSTSIKFAEFFRHFKTGIEILRRHKIKVISHSPISLLNGVIEYEKLRS